MTTEHTLDVRGLTHDEKQEKLFPLLESLKEGECLSVMFDFDPLPLVYMLGMRSDLTVAKEQKAAAMWVMKIEKNSNAAAKAPSNETVTKEILKSLLRELKNEGVNDDTKQKANKLLSSVDAKTLGLLEQELILEGVTHQEIRKSLCDVYLEALAESLIEKRVPVSAPHPVNTLMEEHKIIVNGLHELKAIVERMKSCTGYDDMGGDLDVLKKVSHLMVEAELHHQREEDALFPRLRLRGVTEPPDIMQEEHAEFRERKRALFALVSKGEEAQFEEFKREVIDHGEFISRELESHIFKEDNILYQIALQVFTEDDWREVKRDCDKIGYCCFKPQDQLVAVELDLQSLPPPQRHRQIFEKWGSLPSGGVLRITNDHDPRPLYYQFEAEHKGAFTWVYDQQGPQDWVVRIGRK